MPAIRFTTLALALLACLGCFQPNGQTLDRLVIGEVMTHSEFAQNLRSICVPGGRLTGSENGDVAGRFVADRLRAYGLKNVHFEPFETSAWRVNRTTVTQLAEPPIPLADAVALRNTQSTPPDGLTAELIDLGNGDPADFDHAGNQVHGKFVLVRDGHHKRMPTMQCALEHGAAGLIIASEPNRPPIIGNCHPEPRPEPGIVITHDDGERLATALASGQPVSLNVQVDADIWDAQPNNVVAELPGTGPQAREVAILCAHLDSWHLAEGAIDNGNGSATILETARALSALPWHPRRTIRFIWFMGEEQDLLGSRAHVAAHAADLDRIVAVVNVDMPGSPRRLVTSGPPEFLALIQSVARDLPAYEIETDHADLAGGFSDHAPFVSAGITGFALWGEIGPGVSQYHTPGDKYDVVDRRGTVQSAAVLAVLMRHLADEPRLPLREHGPR